MPAQKRSDARKRLLAALFVKAQNHGIEADELREDIAPVVIGKRLSSATAQELMRVIEHIVKLGKPLSANPPCPPYQGGNYNPPDKGGREEGEFKRYESSRAGLIEELTDAARARWGAEFEKSLNAFVNSHAAKAVTHYRFLDVAALKAVKERIKELSAKDVCATFVSGAKRSAQDAKDKT